jgi:hypothetical protein
MAKTTQLTETEVRQALLDDVAWDVVMKAERRSGGHREIMDALFARSVILGGFIQDDWQGYLAYAYTMPSKHVAIISDSFGSCSGCDSWEDTTDEEAKRMITAMVTSAHIEPDEKSALAWLRSFPDADADNYSKYALPTEQWALRHTAHDLADDIEARKLITIPKDTPPTTCKACGATMYFVGKNPISVDTPHGKAPQAKAAEYRYGDNRASNLKLGEGRGISHFANCPNANEFRRKT